MSFKERLSERLARTRTRFNERINIILDRGPDVDDEFWDDLEETLIMSDFGALAADKVITELQDRAKREALPDANAVLERLSETIANLFTRYDDDIFACTPSCVLFVGINGSGKTTTVGKLAAEDTGTGKCVLLGSADTFRAAAIEQLEVWAKRADVKIVERERGADPASVVYDTVERAEQTGADLVLVDTAGRLHTSDDLMRELEKTVGVARKRAAKWEISSNQPAKAFRHSRESGNLPQEATDFHESESKGRQDTGTTLPGYTVLVIDATTGQNGLQQAREFNKALNLDGLIVTKLDGTAKGGIAAAISHELKLPIYRIGVGEQIEDLRHFDAEEFAKALIGQ
jgi:fused signal recognition particle receptor